MSCFEIESCIHFLNINFLFGKFNFYFIPSFFNILSFFCFIRLKKNVLILSMTKKFVSENLKFPKKTFIQFSIKKQKK